VWRFLQAIGGCAGMVISRAVVRDCFDAQASAKVYSQLMLVMGVAPIVAPALGAQVMAWLGWSSLFWSLALFGAICAAATIT
ncbi:MFS transporter, partial [Acinetobacter baumannii]